MLIHSPADLSQQLRDRRRQLGLSQSAIGEEVALRQDTVSKFETKPDNTRLDTLFRLLSALNLELHTQPKEDASSEGSPHWTEPW